MSDAESGVAAVAARLGVDHRHAPATLALVGGFAAVLGLYASWLTADLGFGPVALVVVSAAGAVGLYRQPTARAVAVRGLYALAAAIALTPVLMNLPFVLAAGRFGVADTAAFVLRLSDLVYLLAFALLAAVPAALGRWLSRGRPLLDRRRRS